MTKIRFQKLDFGNQFSEIRVQKTDLRSQNPAELTGVNNKNTKCPIDAHCHRHCRRDPRITKAWKILQVLSFRVFLDFGKNFLSFLRKFLKLLPKVEENSDAKTCRTSMQYAL